jgi:hypothetical protein
MFMIQVALLPVYGRKPRIMRARPGRGLEVNYSSGAKRGVSTPSTSI